MPNPKKRGSRVSVHVRIRPLSENELKRGDTKLELEISPPPDGDESAPAARHSKYGLKLTTPPTENDSIKTVQVLGFTVPKMVARRDKSYRGFRRVASESVKNRDFFRTSVSPAVRAALAGRTSCVFAYGHTGAGKSHTILGDGAGEPGMYEQASAALFEQMAERMRGAGGEEGGGVAAPDAPLLQVRFGEIYNGEFYDLLGGGARCYVREDADGKIRIRGETDVDADGTVSTKEQAVAAARVHEEALEIVRAGIAARKVGSSGVHDQSSRSHAVLELEIVSQHIIDLREKMNSILSEKIKIGHQHDVLTVDIHARQHVKEEGMWVQKPDAKPTTEEEYETIARLKKESKVIEKRLEMTKTAAEAATSGAGCLGGTLVFVDLAGSEHAGKAGEGELSKTRTEQNECREINKSLGALGGCFRALSTGSRSGSCYRGSKLTLVLRDHLRSPDAGTIMVAAISPSSFHTTKTIHTMQYAQLVAGY